VAPDGRSLYVTSEVARPAVGWTGPAVQVASGLGLIHATGTLSVVDMAQLERRPRSGGSCGRRAVVARVAAGCTPVRVALSPGGETAWVTARASDALLAFSTARLLSDPAHALVATTPTGPLPVGVVLVANGAAAVVANSNRRVGERSPQTLSLIDTAATTDGRAALRGTVRVSAFPRDMALAPDGGTLFVSDFDGETLTIIAVADLPRG
jgi:DNA-binding beta-propeller fold protein YncE